ncbi:MAG: hypothetical protein Q9218_002855 [Villophora microphyllina]
MRANLSSWLALCVILSFRIAATTPVPASVEPDAFSVPATNLSNLPNLPDKDYEAVSHYGPTPLRERACVLVATSVMHTLALHHIDDVLPGGPQVWTHPLDPSVVLWITPPEGSQETAVRFAMWTLFAAFRDMSQKQRFNQMEYLGAYRQQAVAGVAFYPAAKGLPNIAGKNLTVALQPLQLTGDILSKESHSGFTFSFGANSTALGDGSDTPANDDKLHAHVDYIGKVVDQRDIWMMILWFQLNLAPHNRTPISVFQTVLPGITAKMYTIWNSVKPPPGTQPHSFGGGDLISLLAILAQQLSSNRQFREMNIAVSDRGVIVARGLIRANPLSGTSVS